MKNIFLDTNVILDFLADRKPYSEHAAKLFSLADRGDLHIYVSAISFNNVYYVIRKVWSHQKAVRLIAQLEALVTIISVDGKILRGSMIASFRDLEDAIQHQCALSDKKIECIATRNNKDFKKSLLPVFSPEEVIKLIKINS